MTDEEDRDWTVRTVVAPVEMRPACKLCGTHVIDSSCPVANEHEWPSISSSVQVHVHAPAIVEKGMGGRLVTRKWDRRLAFSVTYRFLGELIEVGVLEPEVEAGSIARFHAGPGKLDHVVLTIGVRDRPEALLLKSKIEEAIPAFFDRV